MVTHGCAGTMVGGIAVREGDVRYLAALSPAFVDSVYQLLDDAHRAGMLDDDYEEGWEEEVARKAYTADFETTTDLDDCRVWAAATCEIGNPDHVERGTDIGWFLDWCSRHTGCDVYFHNLAFDGAFIMDRLETDGWTWVGSTDSLDVRHYTTVISDTNQVYCIELGYGRRRTVRIMDSLKIVPLSIAQMAKAYDLPILKGSIDYEAYREPGHELTDEEVAYLDNDVRIDAMVMERFLSQGLRKMTAGSNALSDYYAMMGGRRGFRRYFPALDAEEDAFIRRAYRGGWTYADPRHVGQVVGRGMVFDVNSLYPSVMHGCEGERLPYGDPVWFNGKPPVSDTYNLWVAQVTCSFRIRDGHLPCIQLKGNFRFDQTEYLARSDGEVTFTVTNVDWELMVAQYNIYDVRWHGGYMFRSASFLFRRYVDKWTEVKVRAAEEGNGGQRQIAKLMLNSLYGKFATRTTVYSRRPAMVDGVLRYVDLEPTERESVYLPVGVFVTAWARRKTITAAQSVYDRFLYADTDSIHILGDEVPEGLDVDPYRLGAWKHESDFSEAKFLRAKCYVEHEVGRDELTVHVAGMPARCHGQVTIGNFEFGQVYVGKLYTHRVPGGIVLEEGEMQIREAL